MWHGVSLGEAGEMDNKRGRTLGVTNTLPVCADSSQYTCHNCQIAATATDQTESVAERCQAGWRSPQPGRLPALPTPPAVRGAGGTSWQGGRTQTAGFFLT